MLPATGTRHAALTPDRRSTAGRPVPGWLGEPTALRDPMERGSAPERPRIQIDHPALPHGAQLLSRPLASQSDGDRSLRGCPTLRA